ncbi:MAG: hypothetical protein ABFQ65_02990 [Nanoarchaeota archaeon]
MAVKKLALILTTIMFGLTSCSAKNYKPKEKLFMDRQQLVSNEKKNCNVWFEFYSTHFKKDRYSMISDVLRASYYAIYDSKYKVLYLKNRIIKNVGINEIISYNPECKK